MITDTPPYGPPDRVIQTLERYRETGLGGSPITTAQLTRLSMGEEVARRVVLTFKLLDLIDDDGNPTDHLVALKQASSGEFKSILAALLYDEYQSVFSVLGKDVGGRAPSEVEDAFRTFRPDSLRKRQVSLFLGLCSYAGIIPEPPKDKPGPKVTGTPRTTKTAPPKTPRSTGAKAGNGAKTTDERAGHHKPDEATSRYLTMLLAKAEAQDPPDPELLDRIERVLGIATATEVSTS